MKYTKVSLMLAEADQKVLWIDHNIIDKIRNQFPDVDFEYQESFPKQGIVNIRCKVSYQEDSVEFIVIPSFSCITYQVRISNHKKWWRFWWIW